LQAFSSLSTNQSPNLLNNPVREATKANFDISPYCHHLPTDYRNCRQGWFPEDFLQERVFHSEQAVPLFEGGLQDLVDGEEAIMGAQQSV